MGWGMRKLRTLRPYCNDLPGGCPEQALGSLSDVRKAVDMLRLERRCVAGASTPCSPPPGGWLPGDARPAIVPAKPPCLPVPQEGRCADARRQHLSEDRPQGDPGEDRLRRRALPRLPR